MHIWRQAPFDTQSGIDGIAQLVGLTRQFVQLLVCLLIIGAEPCSNQRMVALLDGQKSLFVRVRFAQFIEPCPHDDKRMVHHTLA